MPYFWAYYGLHWAIPKIFMNLKDFSFNLSNDITHFYPKFNNGFHILWGRLIKSKKKEFLSALWVFLRFCNFRLIKRLLKDRKGIKTTQTSLNNMAESKSMSTRVRYLSLQNETSREIRCFSNAINFVYETNRRRSGQLLAV